MRALDDLVCAFLSSVRGCLSPSESSISMSYQELGNPSPYRLTCWIRLIFLPEPFLKKLSQKLLHMLHTRLVFWWSWTTLRKNMDEFGKGFGVWLRQVPVRLSNRHGITNITDICFVLFRSIGWIRLCKTAVSPIVKRSSLLPKENCDCNNYNSCWVNELINQVSLFEFQFLFSRFSL